MERIHIINPKPMVDRPRCLQAASKVQTLVTVCVMALYASLLHMLHDDMDPSHLRQAIKARHISDTKNKHVTEDGVYAMVEEFLDGLYEEDAVLSWETIIEAPGLRQIILKEVACFVSTAPGQSCHPVLVDSDDFNTTCILCWQSVDQHTHICYSPDPDDGDNGNCVNGCEHGFGYCAQLGDTAFVEGYFIPEGGHGLYLLLNANQGYRSVLHSLRNKHWLRHSSRYVSLTLTTLANVDSVARVRLHFVKYLPGEWSMTYDLLLARHPDYFPSFEAEFFLDETKRCEKILHYFTLGPRDLNFREMIQGLLLLPLPVLVLLTVTETRFFWQLFVATGKPTWEDIAVLVINVASLTLNSGVVAVLFLGRVGIISVICKEYANQGKLKWLGTAAEIQLMCLTLLWFVKLFCLQSVLFKSITHNTRLARGGLPALLLVPFFLLPLTLLSGATMMLNFADESSSDLGQALVTTAWGALGQVHLEIGWPVVLVVRLVVLLLLLPLGVALSAAAIIYILVSSEEEMAGREEKHTVYVPL